jgi:hypothetical protein
MPADCPRAECGAGAFAGSTWDREVRRCSGWAGSGVRAILRSETCAGVRRWNCTTWQLERKKYKRYVDPRRGKVMQYEDAGLRIVSRSLWQAAQERTGLMLPGMAEQRQLMTGTHGVIRAVGSGGSLHQLFMR